MYGGELCFAFRSQPVQFGQETQQKRKGGNPTGFDDLKALRGDEGMELLTRKISRTNSMSIFSVPHFSTADRFQHCADATVIQETDTQPTLMTPITQKQTRPTSHLPT